MFIVYCDGIGVQYLRVSVFAYVIGYVGYDLVGVGFFFFKQKTAYEI